MPTAAERQPTAPTGPAKPLMPQQRLYSTREARVILGNISHSLLYAMVARGEISLTKLGKRSFVAATEIDRLVAGRNV